MDFNGFDWSDAGFAWIQRICRTCSLYQVVLATVRISLMSASRLPGICWTHTEILGKAFFSASAEKRYKQDIQRRMIHVIFPYSPTLYLFLKPGCHGRRRPNWWLIAFPVKPPGPGPIKDCLDRVAEELCEAETITGDRLREIIAQYTEVPEKLAVVWGIGVEGAKMYLPLPAVQISVALLNVLPFVRLLTLWPWQTNCHVAWV